MAVEIEMRVDNSETVISELDAAVVRALTMIGIKAEGNAKKLCPVDTGRLRNSISWAVRDDSVYIGTNVKYAPYVELGTSRMAERPYLRPAVVDHVNEYKAIVQSQLKNT